MTNPAGLGLAHVTVSTARRRLDIALPETVVVGELLPHVLRHAGEGVADDGEQHGGWALRTNTGRLLEPARNLVAQGVHDGEILHLVPRRIEWPELAYDDVVEVIASGSRRTGRSWGKAATRRFALTVAGVVFGLGVLGVVSSGPPWFLSGVLALCFAAATAVTGIILSRALSDALAGALVATCGLPYAAAGGFMVVAPDGVPLTRLGAPQVLLAASALLLFAIVGYVGVAAMARLFVAGIAIGALGALMAMLCYAGMSASGAAAVAVTIAIGLLPGYPLVSVWLGRLPVPSLPDRPEEMLADHPVPRRSEVFGAVRRSHELLTGLLLAAAITSAVGFLTLRTDRSGPAALLTAAGAVAVVLQARLFPTPAQRVPLVASGLIGLSLVAWQGRDAVTISARPLVPLIGAAVAAALAVAVGLIYSVRPPSPYLRRLADIGDIIAIIALMPLAAAVVGLYRAVQGLFAALS